MALNLYHNGVFMLKTLFSKYAPILFFLLAGLLFPVSSFAEWTSWEQIHGADKGMGGGLDISYSQTKDPSHQMDTYFRLRSRYSEKVHCEVEVTIQDSDGSVQTGKVYGDMNPDGIDQDAGNWLSGNKVVRFKVTKLEFPEKEERERQARMEDERKRQARQEDERDARLEKKRKRQALLEEARQLKADEKLKADDKRKEEREQKNLEAREKREARRKEKSEENNQTKEGRARTKQNGNAEDVTLAQAGADQTTSRNVNDNETNEHEGAETA